MNRFVQVPAKGQPMTAQWGADVANGLNAIRSAGQAGMLLTDGPTGTGFSPLPANRRDRRGGKEIQPREFALRAKVETKTEGDAKKYRLKISVFHVHGSSSVTWNGMHIPSNLTDTDHDVDEYVASIGKWIELETTEWTESFDFNKSYYLCVSVEVEFDGEGKERQYNFSKTGMTFWEIKEEAIPVVIYQGDFTWHCQAPYLLGHVKALGTNIEVRQNYDGPLHLFDLMGQIGDEGEGGEGDDGSAIKAYRSCFRLERRQQGEDKSELMLVCCYYHVGGRTKHMADMSVESLLPPQVATGGDGGEGELNPWLLCLKLSGAAADPEIVSIEESSLESEQRSADLYILPLYRFLGRELQDDLRNAPNIQQWELDLT